MTKEQKVEAYSMYLDGCTYQEIGDKFGISRQRVHQLLSEPLTNKRGKPKSYQNHAIMKGCQDSLKIIHVTVMR